MSITISEVTLTIAVQVYDASRHEPARPAALPVCDPPLPFLRALSALFRIIRREIRICSGCAREMAAAGRLAARC
jgi:hypothetical protein